MNHKILRYLSYHTNIYLQINNQITKLNMVDNKHDQLDRLRKLETSLDEPSDIFIVSFPTQRKWAIIDIPKSLEGKLVNRKVK